MTVRARSPRMVLMAQDHPWLAPRILATGSFLPFRADFLGQAQSYSSTSFHCVARHYAGQLVGLCYRPEPESRPNGQPFMSCGCQQILLFFSGFQRIFFEVAFNKEGTKVSSTDSVYTRHHTKRQVTTIVLKKIRAQGSKKI